MPVLGSRENSKKFVNKEESSTNNPGFHHVLLKKKKSKQQLENEMVNPDNGVNYTAQVKKIQKLLNHGTLAKQESAIQRKVRNLNKLHHYNRLGN